MKFIETIKKVELLQVKIDVLFLHQKQQIDMTVQLVIISFNDYQLVAHDNVLNVGNLNLMFCINYINFC